ncbi:hypothetical protein J1N35_007701 [Gossypium stocksii]|uniref:Uncharacterized protein n=1 Tax=Gossypium stocksii TaxID=47602 RepID=A0A9D3W7Y3_9ROSI|nr:hypothetical protein J1N35_007701 [Gossypium stocksii]
MPDSNKNQALDNIKVRFALEVSDNYVKKALGKKNGETIKVLLEEKLRNAPLGMLMYQWEDAELLSGQKEKVKDKRAEYEAITSSDSFFILENIDNQIITEVLGLERYSWVRFQGSFVNPTQYFRSNSQQYMPSGNQAQAEVQRLRDQMTQMQVSIVEQIAQLKVEAASREVEAQRKYEEL